MAEPKIETSGSDKTDVKTDVAGIVTDTVPEPSDQTVGADASPAEAPTPEPTPESRLLDAVAEGDTRAEDLDADKHDVDTPDISAKAQTVTNDVPPVPTVIHKGPGFVAMVAGGVVAALIGVGGTIYALPYLPSGLLPVQKPDMSAFDTAIKTAVDQQKAQFDALVTEVNSLKSSIPQAPDLSGVQGALDEAGATVRGLSSKIDGIEGRLSALETRPVVGADGTPVNDATAMALQGQIDTLRDQVNKVGGSAGAVEGQINDAAASVKAQLSSVQAEAEKLRGETETAGRRSVAQAAIARVAAALQSGVPLASAVGAAESAGLTVPPALKADVTPLPVLQASFPEAARSALLAARKSMAGSTIWQRLGSFVMAQTGARSVTPRDGDDADAVLSRMQAAVDAGNIAQALKEADALPQAAQAMLSGWIAQAQTRIAAGQAMADLANSVQ